MKKLLLVILALGPLVFGGTYNKSIKGNIGQSIPLFGAQPNTIPVMGAQVNLDTMEADTGYYFYDLIDKPVIGTSDTVGQVHFTCKDSTGTDSVGVRVEWQGNMREDGNGTWASIDTVRLNINTSSNVYTNATPTAVINSKSYMALRFIVKNMKNGSVAQKSVCKDFVLNRRPRMALIGSP